MSKQCADECGRYSGFDPWFTVSEWNTPQSVFWLQDAQGAENHQKGPETSLFP